VDRAPIEEIAARDRLQGGDADTLSLRQFILDHDFRCVIPHDDAIDLVARAVRDVLPDTPILDLHGGCPLLGGDSSVTRRLSEFSPKEALEMRDHVAVVEITADDLGYEWLGRVFPRMIIYTSSSRQYTFRLSGMASTSAPHHAASILFPAVVKAMRTDRNLKRDSLARFALMGTFAGLMRVGAAQLSLRDRLLNDNT
jgi:hypothetical protein